MKSLLLGAVALLLCAAPLAAQSVAAPETRRAPVDEAADSADRPTPPLKVVIPAISINSNGNNGMQPGAEMEAESPPEELPENPPTEGGEPPTFFGEPVQGRFVWCIDRSGSMGIQDSGIAAVEDRNGNIYTNPSRLQRVKAEVVNVLLDLTETDEFALVWFGGCPGISSYLTLVRGTEGNRQQGISTVNGLTPFGGTPVHGALMKTLTQYGTQLDKIFFLCDGMPTYGPTANEILGWFPGQFQPFRDNGCEFVATHMGDSGEALAFMQNLTNSVGGTFYSR